MKTIVFFSPYILPYISGITVANNHIIEYLAKESNIIILTFDKNNSFYHESMKGNIRTVFLPYIFKIHKGYISPASFIYYWKFSRIADAILVSLPNIEGLLLSIFAKYMRKPLFVLLWCDVILEGSFIYKSIEILLRLSVYIQCLISDRIFGIIDYIDSIKYVQRMRSKIVYCIPDIKKVEHVNRVFIDKFKKLKNDSTWILFVGRISKEKGIEYLIQAMEKINGELIFAGPSPEKVVGEKSYQKYIYSLIEKTKIHYREFFDLSNEKLTALYQLADTLVLPSISATEAFGIVQAESLMQNTPVIVSDLPGVRYIVSQVPLGLIIKPKDSESIVNAVKYILDNRRSYFTFSQRKALYELLNSKAASFVVKDIIWQYF